MGKFGKLFKSRTFWTLVGGTAYNIGVQYVAPAFVGTPAGMAINIGLGLAGTYFHANPTQDFTPTGMAISQSQAPPAVKAAAKQAAAVAAVKTIRGDAPGPPMGGGTMGGAGTIDGPKGSGNFKI